MKMTNFFKEAEAFFTIAKEIKPCVTAFKTQNYENNPKYLIRFGNTMKHFDFFEIFQNLGLHLFLLEQ